VPSTVQSTSSATRVQNCGWVSELLQPPEQGLGDLRGCRSCGAVTATTDSREPHAPAAGRARRPSRAGPRSAVRRRQHEPHPGPAAGGDAAARGRRAPWWKGSPGISRSSARRRASCAVGYGCALADVRRSDPRPRATSFGEHSAPSRRPRVGRPAPLIVPAATRSRPARRGAVLHSADWRCSARDHAGHRHGTPAPTRQHAYALAHHAEWPRVPHEMIAARLFGY
jgi:hypothetical protein